MDFFFINWVSQVSCDQRAIREGTHNTCQTHCLGIKEGTHIKYIVWGHMGHSSWEIILEHKIQNVGKYMGKFHVTPTTAFFEIDD